MSSPRAILLVKPSALGDVIQHVVVARALAERFPAAEIGWLVKSNIAAMIEPLPFLTHLHRFEREKMRGLGGVVKGRESLSELRRELRAVGYEMAIDLQGLARSAFLAKASGAKRRIGFREAKEFAWLLYTESYRTKDGQHVLDRAFDLLDAAGLGLDRNTATDLATSEIEAKAIRAKVKSERPLIVVSPGSLWPSKIWPAEYFIAAGQTLSRHGQVVVSGAPNEAELCARVAAGIEGAIDLSGKTSLRELAALFSIAALAIANDSAPTHLARAQNCPQVALFGTSDPVHAGPWRRPEDVIYSPTAERGRKVYRRIPDDRIMRAIAVQDVVDKAIQKLKAARE